MSSHDQVTAGPIHGPVEHLGDLLVVDNVCKSFRLNNGSTLFVLKDFSLTVKNIKNKPQVLSLLGPSGSGKTTALRIIAGLDKPTSGQVRIGSDGAALELRPVRIGDVGVVFQRYPLFDDLHVLDNLVVPAVHLGMGSKEAAEKGQHFLNEFGLGQQAQAWPAQLSGGQRQRVAILQQLMRDRHFIILDEPFSGLDPVNIQGVINLIVRIANQHTLNTFIVVTHDVTSALIISDHVYLLGRPRNAKGVPVDGGKVMKEYDLISEGLAYRPEIEDLPRFAEIRKEIKMVEFPKL
jgi:polar amino acid transport system ATP-binding protein/sulfate transport system ATP-binding protein